MNFNTGFQNRTKIGKISIWLEKRGKKSMHSRKNATFADCLREEAITSLCWPFDRLRGLGSIPLLQQFNN